MFESIINFFKKIGKQEKEQVKSKDAAKERLHLVLMQDRANVSADFLDLMKQEIIEVIKKYIDVDENAIDVRLTNKANADGTTGAPALYANIPIVSIKEEVKSGMARQKDTFDKTVEKQQEDVSKEPLEQSEKQEENKTQEETPKTEPERKEEEKTEIVQEEKVENPTNPEETKHEEEPIEHEKENDLENKQEEQSNQTVE